MRLTYNDEQHAYWLDGTRCKGVTSVASYPDDKYAINQWRARSIVTGMALSPPLVHRAVAHFDERDKLEEIAEEAMVLAKTHEAAGRGTADHRITERVDLGLTVIDTPETLALAVSWRKALDHIGVEIDPALVERIVVYPDELVAGRFDRIARYKTTGRHVIVDVKTGLNAIKYPHSTAIQCALYANAPLLAAPLTITKGADGYATDFEPLPPDIHTDHAIVVYLPPEGPARCFKLNIAAGWEAARDICFPTSTWRKRADLVQEITLLLATEPPDDEQAYLARLDRTEWLRDRVEAIKQNDAAKALLAVLWSQYPEIPTFKRGGPRTDDELDVVADLCDKVEAEHNLPFGTSDPTITTGQLTKRSQTL